MKIDKKAENLSPARAVAAWLQERFAPLVSLPLAAILAVSGQSGHPVLWQSLPAKIIHAWLMLLALRIIDDVTDLEHDRIWHPRRILSSGRVSPSRLVLVAGISVLVAAVLNLVAGELEQTLILVAVYLPFFFFKSKIPAMARPFWINLVFGLLIANPASVSASRLALGAFGWLAATGHDFCHSIADMVEQSHSSATRLRQAALTGIACYGLSFVLAVVALVLEPNPIMAIVLAGAGFWLGIWLHRLWGNPGVQTARALYVRGFVAFVLPLMARIVGMW